MSRYIKIYGAGKLWSLATASPRGRKRISRHLRTSRNKWERDNEKTRQINVNVKWQQSLRITAKRLLSLALKDTGNGKENWALDIRGQKGRAALGGLRDLHHPSLPWHRGKEPLPGGTLEFNYKKIKISCQETIPTLE